MNNRSTVIEKLGHYIGVAGNAALMNLLFLVPCFATLLLLLGVNWLYSAGFLGSSILVSILMILAILPMALIGQFLCGLLSGIRYNIRGEKWFAGFKKGFSTRFWRGTIAWTILLLVNVYMILDVQYAYLAVINGKDAWSDGYLVQLIFASIILAGTTMFTTSLLFLNVYIPTPIGRWLESGANMVFKAPLPLLGAAAAFWFPVVLGFLRFDYFWYSLIIFLAIYFSVAGLVSTMLLKNTLIDYLVDARVDGVLLAEEGRVRSEDDDEEYEDDEEEE